MKETVLFIALIAFIFLGYFPMKRLDFFLEKNRKRMAEEKEEDAEIGIISLRIADGSKISDDKINELSEMYPMVELTLKNREIRIICKSESIGETEIFIGSLLSVIEKDA